MITLFLFLRIIGFWGQAILGSLQRDQQDAIFVRLGLSTDNCCISYNSPAYI